MNVDFADEEMIAYRESLIEKKKEQPFWKKKCLSVNGKCTIASTP